MPAGWNIRVTTFDSEGKPRIVRNFLAYESDKERAIQLVCKRVPVNKGELAEAVAEVSGDEFVGTGMRPGDVRRHSKKENLDEGEQPWGIGHRSTSRSASHRPLRCAGLRLLRNCAASAPRFHFLD